jgi:hypothetical protein
MSASPSEERGGWGGSDLFGGRLDGLLDEMD